MSDPVSDRGKAAQVGKVIGQRRGHAVPLQRPGDGLTIAVGTSPQGLSLANEARLAKAALLYADRVVLYQSTLRRPAPVYEALATFPLGGP